MSKKRIHGTISALACLAVTMTAGGLVKTPDAVAAEPDPVFIAYGQTFKPGLITFSDSDYTWNDLSHLPPVLLKDYNTLSLSTDQACDKIVEATDQALIDIDLLYADLTLKAAPIYPDKDMDLEVDAELSNVMASRSPKALYELMLAMPHDQPELIMAKDLTLKSLAMILLHDAALTTCPDHARQKGYSAIIPQPQSGETHH
ncbi:MAG TPA: hypothetical protein PLO23_04290 [Alphaproteobacteria bacterium]|nr:hypothetical protein [Alphaproteobacteria bacterium]